MKIRQGHYGRVLALGVVATLASTVAFAAPPLPKQENSLLGIRLLGTYKDVLKKFGQPHEIQIGAPQAPAEGQTATASAGRAGGGGMMGQAGGMAAMMGQMRGGPTAGGGGIPGGPPASMMGQMMGAGRGAPTGGGGLPGFAQGRAGGMAGGGIPGGPTAGMMAMMGGGRGMSGAGMPSGMMGGMPGGMMGAGGMAGMMGGGGGADTEAPADPTEGEITWWYHYPRPNGIHYAFLFNKEGHIIQIQSFGWKGDPRSKTVQGITLGSGLNAVLRKYGWSNDGVNSGKNLVMTYGSSRRLAFQLVDNKVAGISLGVGSER